MRENPRCVLFLGAGASAPWGLPVMSQFMAVARRRRLEWERRKAQKQSENKPVDIEWCDHLLRAYETLFKFQESCRRGSWALNRDWDNIEEVYSQADLLRISGIKTDLQDPSDSSNPLSPDRLCLFISLCIWDIYRKNNKSSTGLSYPYLNRFIEECHNKDLTPVIITTNYDVQIERNLIANESSFFYPSISYSLANKSSHWISLWANHQFEGWTASPMRRDTGSPDLEPEKDTVPISDPAVCLIKLHGSVNWIESNTLDENGDSHCLSTCFFNSPTRSGSEDTAYKAISEDEFRPVGLYHLSHALGCEPWSDEDTKRGQLEYFKPMIVPPLLGKTARHSVFSSQIREAVNALGEASIIAFVGYSFPATDVFMTRLLSEALARNTILNHLWVFDRCDRSSWDERLKKMFSPVFRQSKLHFLQADAGKLFAKGMPMIVDALERGDESWFTINQFVIDRG